MLTALYRDILIPAFEAGLKRRPTFSYWRELERTQWLPRVEVERIQFDALGRLLRKAQERCLYYRDAWRALGLDANSLQRAEDFARWPVIDRQTVREHRMSMRTPGLELIAKSTGGSSGVPLQFDHDLDSYSRRMAAWHRGYSWAGAAPGTKQVFLWGVALGRQPAWKRVKERLYAGLYRRVVLNSFELSEASLARFLQRLNRARPDVIVAYTNSLYSFARMLDERRLRPFSPRSIVVGAEQLHPFQRDLIERVFAAPVFETYGSREFMLIGAECERHQGLHLTTEQLLVEVLDDEGRPTPPGQEGNVVVTDLYNYGMPFIRYANGDRAVAGLGECPCGRGLPVLTRVVGRRVDTLTTPDGRRVSGLFFPHLLKDFPAVRRFQVVQQREDHVVLRLVAQGEARAVGIPRIEEEARQVLGPRVRFEIERVESIPLTPAGKLQVVVTNVGKPGKQDVQG